MATMSRRSTVVGRSPSSLLGPPPPYDPYIDGGPSSSASASQPGPVPSAPVAPLYPPLSEDLRAQRAGSPLRRASTAPLRPVVQQEDEEEVRREIKHIQQETQRVQKASLHVARETVKKIRDTECIAYATADRLQEQSEHLDGIRRRISVANENVVEARHQARQLRRLSQIIPVSLRDTFRSMAFWKKDRTEPGVPLSNAAARLAHQQALQTRERDLLKGRRLAQEREQKRHQRMFEEQEAQARRFQARRVRYSKGNEAENIEAEILEHLDDMSDAVGKLKSLSIEMGAAIDKQNETLEDISEQAAKIDGTLFSTSRALGKMIAES